MGGSKPYSPQRHYGVRYSLRLESERRGWAKRPFLQDTRKPRYFPAIITIEHPLSRFHGRTANFVNVPPIPLAGHLPIMCHVHVLANVKDESELTREPAKLKSPDILAIKGLAQFEKFPAVVALGNLIENWHISDFHISMDRPEQPAGYAEHLSTEGENLALVTEFLNKRHPKIFADILKKLSRRVPGISNVEAKTTEEGRALLRFRDGAFEDPFLSRFVSDGTIKMLAYLILLHDPQPHSLLCVEEPENQLYPKLLHELAEEFRLYARRVGQVFVSTHSPDFLNAAKVDEVFWLIKKDGYTSIMRAADDDQIVQYMAAGDQMGSLWRQGLLDGADPQ